MAKTFCFIQYSKKKSRSQSQSISLIDEIGVAKTTFAHAFCLFIHNSFPYFSISWDVVALKSFHFWPILLVNMEKI